MFRVSGDIFYIIWKKNIKTNNCIVCSFENKDEKKCTMCMSELETVKLVSSTEGDTTCMCASTCKTLLNLLKTIMYALRWQKIHKKHVFILSRPPGHHTDNRIQAGFVYYKYRSYL